MKAILSNLFLFFIYHLLPTLISAATCTGGSRLWLNCYSCTSTSCTNCVAGYEPASDGRCNRCGGGKYGNGGQSACITCPAGSYAPSASPSCYPCPGGTYSGAGAAGCSSCLVGQYSDATSGATSCSSCPSGTYATTAVSSLAGCAPCPAGQSSSPGSSSCTACAAGQWTVSGSAACVNCIAGTWSNSGDGVCTPCPGGTYSGAASSTCLACGPGTYAPPGSSGCTQCPAGTYAAVSAGSCTPCAAGTYSTVTGAIDASSCLPCSAGEYSNAGSTQCTICKAGTYSTASSGSCTNCPAGQYSGTGATSCLTCSAGQYSTSGSSSCTTCPAGTWSASAAGACTSCNAGQWSSSGSTSCNTCTAGQYSAAGADACSTCPGGQYSTIATASCNLCTAGSYSTAGSSSCTTCLDGQYSGDGAASCTTCGPGKYSLAGASLCSTCEAGKYSPGGVAACSTCPAGKYSNAGASSCTTCSAGYYSGAGAPSCTICPAGTYSLANSASCTDCPAGRYSSSGAGACSLCPAGQYSNVKSISCSICPIGTYSLQDSASCTLCPSGTYSPSAGAPALASCLACPAGQYSDSGASSCKICPAGSYSSTGASSCDLCPGGYYSAPSSASCTICPPGQYSSAGSASCSICVAGMYAPAGSQSCILCEAGQYSSSGAGSCLTCLAGQFSNAGSSSCTTCPAGYNSSSGAASCGICAAGQFSNAGSEFCTLCPEGTFSSLPGATSFGACMYCPPGYYSKEGAGFCLMCIAGTYSLGGVSECTDCPSGQFSHDGASTCFATTDNLFARASAISSSVVSKIGSSICVGNSMFANLGLITKLVQNIRYMELNVSNELDNAFKSWESDILAWQIPGKLSSMSESEDLPFVFARYDLDSRFLVNYWFTLVLTLSGFIMYGGLRLSKFLLEVRLKKHKMWHSVLDGMVVAAFNFAFVQVYTSLGDIVFYSILDLRFTKFSPKFSMINSLMGILLLTIGVCILLGHFGIVYRYTKFKKISERALETFTKKFQLLKVLYDDYKDTGYFRHAYFAFLVTRAMLASLIIVAFYEQPLAQAIMLVLMNCLMLGFLISKGPFKGVYDELMQYFYELIVFIVHFTVLLMAIADQKGEVAYNMRIRIGQCIIFLNTLLFLGSLVFMCIEVYKKLVEIYEYWLEYRKNKKLVKRQSTPQLLRAQSNLLTETTRTKGGVHNKSEMMKLFDSSSIINQETNMSPQRRMLESSEINVMDLSLENSVSGGSSMTMMMLNSRKKKFQIKAKKSKKDEDDLYSLSLIRSGIIHYGRGGETSSELGHNLKPGETGAGDEGGRDFSQNRKGNPIKGGLYEDNSSINSEPNPHLKDVGGRDLSRHLRDSPSKWDNQSGRSTPIGIKQSHKERTKSPLKITQEDRLKTKDSPYRYLSSQETGDLSGLNLGPSLSFESNFRKGSEAQGLLCGVEAKDKLSKEKGMNQDHKADGEAKDLTRIAERTGQKQGKLASALIDQEIDALDRLIEDDLNKKNMARNEQNKKDSRSESESPQRRKRNNIKVRAGGQDPNMTQLMMLGAFNNKFREDILSQYSGLTFQTPGEIFQEKSGSGDKK